MIKEKDVLSLLTLWMLISILFFNEECFIMVIIAITVSELTLIAIDYLNNYTKLYMMLLEAESEKENESHES